MSQQKHDEWHLLIQYGVQELLYFLYECLAELIRKGEKEKAVEELVRRMFLLVDNKHVWLTICFIFRNTGSLRQYSRGL